ncbi:hypothetical protein F5880DRAFT_1593551 [Lentinula raphanica]|nr:hypothetical protein F5880DRAFT_1593551 [Lentinula raphanica]
MFPVTGGVISCSSFLCFSLLLVSFLAPHSHVSHYPGWCRSSLLVTMFPVTGGVIPRFHVSHYLWCRSSLLVLMFPVTGSAVPHFVVLSLPLCS